MKAIVFKQYGSPDVLQLREMKVPESQENEVLVQVHAAAANPLDWHLMRGEPFLARLEAGWSAPKNLFLGADVAGVVSDVGANVTRFKVGDAVMGDKFQLGLGSFAEYVAVPASKLIHKPATISFAEAAATPIAATTALQGLRDVGKVQADQQVLINGASGGVGTFAVQIATALGAEVTGVCSARNHELIQSIGAVHAIDYTQEDFTRSGRQYDLILDAVGNYSVNDLKRALKPGGIASIIGFTTLPRLFEHMLVAPILSMMGSKWVGMLGTVQTNLNDLRILGDMLEQRKITPVIDRCYPLAETAEAIRYLESNRARGKVIITVAP